MSPARTALEKGSRWPFAIGFPKRSTGSLCGGSAEALVATAIGPVDIVLLMGGRSMWNLFNVVVALVLNLALSFILVPLRHPGVRVRGIRQIHGEPGFAEIFFEDAEVAEVRGEEGLAVPRDAEGALQLRAAGEDGTTHIEAEYLDVVAIRA